MTTSNLTATEHQERTTLCTSSSSSSSSPSKSDDDSIPPTILDQLSQTTDSDFVLSRAFGLAKLPLHLLVVLVGLIYKLPIPTKDLIFSIAFPFYLCLANRYRFDNNTAAIRKADGKYVKPGPFEDNRIEPWFANYVASAGVVGVLLPIAMVLAGPTEIGHAQGPHLYLLLSQIFWEWMMKGDRFHPLLFMMLAIGFNAYRLESLQLWLLQGWEGVFSATKDDVGSPWEQADFGLALVNVVLWNYNLFVMLLLRLLPTFLDPVRLEDATVSWKANLVPIIVRETKKKTNVSK